ncbi:MAG: hypothetical protein KDA16_00040 [Phycisphaerales bacterium]|nr:hypothetical protein [Phycisphaerales bacterium]
MSAWPNVKVPAAGEDAKIVIVGVTPDGKRVSMHTTAKRVIGTLRNTEIAGAMVEVTEPINTPKTLRT